MADSDKNLPAPPYKTQFIGSNGLLTEPWSKWIRQLFQRVGGFSAPSNSELGGDFALNADLNALEATVNANNTAINELVDGLYQGRQV